MIRDVERMRVGQTLRVLEELLDRVRRIQAQERHTSPKLYSIHAPETECITKGKIHKKYEFGGKVGLVTPARQSFILGIQAFHGNPYDGHTLDRALSQTERLSGVKILRALTGGTFDRPDHRFQSVQ